MLSIFITIAILRGFSVTSAMVLARSASNDRRRGENKHGQR